MIRGDKKVNQNKWLVKEGREKSAMLDSYRDLFSPHHFIATENLTALSVTPPAELIKQAGWTLYSKEHVQQ